MPTYDYRCTECDERFEKTRPIAESGEDSPCPVCGARSRRAFSPVGVVFKGSGFHNTDYRERPKELPAGAEEKKLPASCPASDSGASCATCPKAD